MKQKSNFTLIELLIVIAIIAILAALLLPALNRARTAAHQATCASNLKQLTMAEVLYSDTYSGYLTGAMNKMGDTYYWWYMLLIDLKYASPALMECKANTVNVVPTSSSETYDTRYYAHPSLQGKRRTYQINSRSGYYLYDGASSTKDFPRTNSFKKTSTAMLFYCGSWKGSNSPLGFTLPRFLRWSYRISYPNESIYPCHGNHFMTGFADGHAGPLSYFEAQNLVNNGELLNVN